SGIGIEAKLQALGVDVIGEGFHSGRESLRACEDEAVFVAAHLPAIVDHDLLIAGVLHAARNHRVRHGLNHFLADVAGELVSCVAAHGWSERNGVITRICSWGEDESQRKGKEKKSFAKKNIFHAGLPEVSARNDTGNLRFRGAVENDANFFESEE